MEITARHGVYESLVNNRFSDKLIISLSGVGNLELDEIRFESWASIEEGAPDISAIYVRDTSRSWYTNEDGFDGLIDFIKAFIDQQNITDVTVYGVSMGGYGAILVARYINASRAIAISPRTLLGKDCTFDHRLVDFAKKLGSIRHPDLSKLDLGDVAVTIISSIDIPEDAAHAALMVGTSAQVLWAHGDHNVSLTLKKKNLLPGFIQACISGTIKQKDFGFFDIPHNLSNAIKLDVIKGNREEAIAQLDSLPQRLTPSFFLSALYDRWISSYIKAPRERCFASIHAYPAHTGQLIESRSLTPYLVSGWSDPEEFGVWGVGLKHSIRLEIIDLNPGDSTMIVVCGKIFTHKNAEKIKVVGYINGQRLTDEKLTAHEYQFSAVVKSSIIDIDFFTENPCSPKSVGLNNDSRELSIAVTKIAIEPAPPCYSYSSPRCDLHDNS